MENLILELIFTILCKTFSYPLITYYSWYFVCLFVYVQGIYIHTVDGRCENTGTPTRQSASVMVLFTYVEYGFITGCFIKVFVSNDWEIMFYVFILVFFKFIDSRSISLFYSIFTTLSKDYNSAINRTSIIQAA